MTKIKTAQPTPQEHSVHIVLQPQDTEKKKLLVRGEMTAV